MADRKLVLLCAASAAAGAVLASGLTAAAVREGVQPPPEPPARRQSAPQAAYTLHRRLPLTLEAGSQYRLRVWLKNGDAAWLSPFFCR